MRTGLREAFESVDRRVAIWIAILIGLTAAIVAMAFEHPVTFIGYDFQAFWCGGKAVLAHANPYLNEPLHTCEFTSSPAFFVRYENVTIPVPLPGYAIALFTPFALLPFAVGRAIWWAILVLAGLSIGRGIARITGMSPITAACASALAVIGPAIVQGALSPVPIAFTVWGAFALQQKRWSKAAVLLGFGMIEPHMVLPACAATFLAVPPMRWRLAVAAMCAAGLMLLAVGPQVALSYFTQILPLHAAAEVNNLGQDSLTAVLYQLHVPASLAIRLGGAQYAILAVIGVIAASRLARRHADLAWLVLLPAGFAVAGGEFIHLDEVSMLIPLACLLLVRYPSRAGRFAVVMLALPVESIINWAVLAVPAAGIATWFVTRSQWLTRERMLGGLLPAIAIGVLIIGGAFGLHIPAMLSGQDQWVPATGIANPGASASASIPWAQFNMFSVVTWLWWVEKVFTFVPVAIVVWIACRTAFFISDTVPTLENRALSEAT